VLPLRLPAATLTRKAVLEFPLDALPHISLDPNSSHSSRWDKKAGSHPRTVELWESCEEVGGRGSYGGDALHTEQHARSQTHTGVCTHCANARMLHNSGRLGPFEGFGAHGAQF
jgi:hypothetical protein